MDNISTLKINHTIHSAGKNSSAFYTKILGICFLTAVVVIVATSVFKLSIGTVLLAGALLLCPLLHVWMMRNGTHRH